MKIQNFGKNVEFVPKFYYEPKTESEVLDILNKHKDGHIRAIGSGHAWSRGIESSDVFVDIKNLCYIKIADGCVDVGGGAKLKNVISYITKRGFMIPAMGGIMKQSVAGLASTGTHGTGNSSFSHFILSVRIASYDENGNSKIVEYTEGDELKAARTSMGLMGIIVSMKIKLVPRYFIEERSKLVDSIGEVLKNEKEFSEQQTVVIPYSWKFFIFGRKKVQSRNIQEKTDAFFVRWIDFLTVEILPHLILRALLLFDNRALTISYYKDLLPKFLFSQKVVNEDYRGLTLHTKHHYYFRHVEMEAFVPESKVKEVFGLMINLVDWFSGRMEGEKLPDNYQEELEDKHGKFVLHYPMFIRKVYPDDTLISMTSGKENYYAIGFFTYKKNENRGDYWDFTRLVAKILSRDYNVRFHWGKHFPLEYDEIKHLYPELEKFKTICREKDKNGVFQNEFTKKVFGF
jgi:hypothetical protein